MAWMKSLLLLIFVGSVQCQDDAAASSTPNFFERYRSQFSKQVKRCQFLRDRRPRDGARCRRLRTGDYTCFFTGDDTSTPTKTTIVSSGALAGASGGDNPLEEVAAGVSSPCMDKETGMLHPTESCSCSEETRRWECTPFNACEVTSISSCPKDHPASASTALECTRSLECDYGRKFCCGSTEPITTCICDANGRFTCTHDISCPEVCPPLQPVVYYRSDLRRLSLPVQIPLLGPHILRGYNRISQLARDLREVVKFLVNDVIESNSRINCNRRFPVVQESIAVADSVAFSSVAAARPVPAAAPPPPSAEGVTDFETNNQEEGVDEADAVKSDGRFNFAAYGDVLLVWNALTGESLFNQTLPPVKQPTPSPTAAPRPFEEGDEPIAISLPFFPRPFFRRRARIRSMLLESNRLVLFVEGYGQEVREAADREFAFFDAFNTRIMIYDTSQLPDALPLLEQKDIQGSFRDARAFGDNIHVVTTANWNTFQCTEPLRRCDDRYEGLSDIEYKITAIQVALTEVVPQCVEKVLRDVTVEGLPSLSRISLWLSNNTEAVETIFRSGVVRSFVQLTSFDVSTAGTKLMKYSVAGSFAPSSWGYTYAVDDMLIFAMQGWNWIPRLGGTGQTTYFVGFRLRGATATPQAIGSTPGFLLNQFSIDIFDGILRVATTIRQFWPPEPEPQELTDENGDELLIAPRPIFRPRFTTQNQIILLKIPTGRRARLLTEVSRVENLGRPREVFTAVRFFDKRAYAVTFELKDPFIVLDLEDSLNPRVLGELNITGFSSYLHPINSDNTRIVAVGQEADERGRVLGLQVTIFNAEDPSNPVLEARFPVELDRDTFSSSAVTWDFRAFRYVSLGEEVGILIMPLTIRSFRRSDTGNFDGFVVLDIARGSIRERLRIPHVDSDQFYGCYYNARLPQRSFVFSGNVTTLKGHSIIATDLDTGERRWRLEAPKPTIESECRFW